MEEEVAFLNKKLNIVGSVTRHDVVNQFRGRLGYTELLEMSTSDPQLEMVTRKGTVCP